MDKFRKSFRRQNSNSKSNNHGDNKKSPEKRTDQSKAVVIPSAFSVNASSSNASAHQIEPPPLPEKKKVPKSLSIGLHNYNNANPDLRRQSPTAHTSVPITPIPDDIQSVASSDNEENEVFTQQKIASKSPVSSPTGSGKFKLSNFFSSSKKEKNTARERYSSESCHSREYSKYYKKTVNPFDIQYVKIYGEDDGAYKNDTSPRGMVFMMNFEEFEDRKFEKREGSRKDFDNLSYLFRNMGYKIMDQFCKSGKITKEQFMIDLEKFVNSRHNCFDSCIIIIMSHGVEDKTFVTYDGGEIDLSDVYRKFSNYYCNSLQGKPKIFILQFCRPLRTQQRKISSSHTGFDIDQLAEIIFNEMKPRIIGEIKREIEAFGVPSNNYRSPSLLDSPASICRSPSRKKSSSSLDMSSSPSLLSIPERGKFDYDALAIGCGERRSSFIEQGPEYSDMFSIFATSNGFPAYRHRKKGSLLIQAICHVFAKYAYKDHIQELGNKVSSYIQKELAIADPTQLNKMGAVERSNNGLDKDFYFNPAKLDVKRRSTITGAY